MFWPFAILAAQIAGTPLEPSGPWTLSTQDDGCRVTRPYKAGSDVQIGSETVVTSRARPFLIVAPAKLLPDGIGEVPLVFDNGVPVNVHYGSFALTEKKLRLVKLFPDDIAVQKLATANLVAIGQKILVLRMTSIKSALTALDKCTAGLLSSWGVDPQIYALGKTATFTGNVAQWFTPASYPKEARSTRAAGRVVLLLKTKEDGSVSDCRVVASADDTLNAGTCAIAIAHVRLKPPQRRKWPTDG